MKDVKWIVSLVALLAVVVGALAAVVLFLRRRNDCDCCYEDAMDEDDMLADPDMDLEDFSTQETPAAQEEAPSEIPVESAEGENN